MIQIDDKIVSLDIIRQKFCCDLSQCRGICCVEGNSGAPIEPHEMDEFEQQYDNYSQWLTEDGIKAIEKQGFGVIDIDNDLTTPLINDKECAYSFIENGITLCAVERAYLQGKSTFRKPISCHLYPIRVARFSNGTLGLNYHCWEICDAARRHGEALGVPLYVSLREPITEHLGEAFYNQLDEIAQILNTSKNEF